MRISLTGGTGFIGRYMIQGLAAAGHELCLLARPGRASALVLPEGANCRVHEGDLTRAESLEGFLEDAELLFHVAGAHDHNEDDVLKDVNILGTENLLTEVARAGLDKDQEFKLWIMSSAVIKDSVYSYYRDSKRIQEKLFRGSGLNWTSFRPTLVYGVGDHRHTAPLLRRCAQKKGSLWVPHSGKSKINPVHVEDVVDAVLRYFGFERGIDCCYELAGPQGITYNEFLDTTIAAAGGSLRRRNISKKWADRLILLKGLFKDTTEDRRASAYFMMHHEHDISNATSELDWSPRPYAQGIREVAESDWWREEPAG